MIKNGYKRTDIVKPNLPNYFNKEIIESIRNQVPHSKCIPDFIIRDIYKGYYHPEMEIHIHKNMYWWHSLFSDLINFLLRMVTKGKKYNSLIVTKNIIEALIPVFKNNSNWKSQTKEENKKIKNRNKDNQEKEQKENANNEQQSESSTPEMSNSQFKKMKGQMQKATCAGIEKAKQEIAEREEAIETLTGGKGGNEAGFSEQDDFKITTKYIQDRLGILQGIKFDKKGLSKFVNKSMKSFKNSIGINPVRIEESILDADEVNDVLEIEYLPQLSLMEDISVSDVKTSLSYDLYIDISGSMSSNLKLGKTTLTRLQLCSILGWKMKLLGVLNNVYTFNSYVHKISEDDILQTTEDGGTRFNKVLENAKKTRNPSVILTDGQDRYGEYLKNIFVMNICEFYNDGSYALNKMIKNRQIAIYKSTGKLEVVKQIKTL
tara:strand:+ start:8852 stop:10150 length:1299 start_codon:yes stop_codon:yes gene_type:complete